MSRQKIPLPIDEVLGEVVASLRTHASVVLRAPPGAGKTTRVPPALAASDALAAGAILMLQPRRVAARLSAARIAAEQGWKLGEEVGYQVRFDSRVSQRTRIIVLTEGVLLRRLQDDPLLGDVAAVIFDEFHERSLASDLALAMVRQVQAAVRPELKIVVMSATLAAKPVQAFLGDCPAVESQGVSYPVSVRYLPPLARQPLVDLVAGGLNQLLPQTAGDCLVFLPGVGEIRACARGLSALAADYGIELCELYGDLPAEKQDQVVQASSRRRIILATNVAETSLTIPGVTAVLDSGLARMLRFDPGTGLDRLELSPISQASAEQRAGRAGRTQPGGCLRLWPEAAHRSRPAFELPEIRRVDLAGSVLQILCWIEPELERFPWFERPSPEAVERAVQLLQALGAMDAGRITPLGRRMASLPVHPRIARLLIEAQSRGATHEATLAAALLSERDPFEREGGRRQAAVRSRSDVLDRVHALAQFEERGEISSDVGKLNFAGAKQVLRVRDQLQRLLGGKAKSTNEEAFLRSLVASYPDRVARRREPGSRRGLLVGGRGVRLGPEVALGDEELYLCIDLDAGEGEAVVRQASAVDRSWLPDDQVRTEVAAQFDEAEGKLSARRRVLFQNLLLEESPAPLPGPQAVAEALAEIASRRLDESLPPADSPAAIFRCRVQCLTEWLPDAQLPALDDEVLRRMLPELAVGRRSLAELRIAPWLEAMRDVFNWQQLDLIEREAPERWRVPSGSSIALQYEVGKPPILAVRIQEIFGLRETPRIARGRVPILLHLLAPNMRVAQVTADLASFWRTTYAVLRKELRARYPKHAWPENPYEALPERRPQRKRP